MRNNQNGCSKSILTKYNTCQWREEGKFVLRPTTGQVRHKAFFKVGPDAEPQPTRVQQNSKIPSAPSTFSQWGRPRCQETNNKHLAKLYLFSVPPPDKYGTRPFLKVGPDAGPQPTRVWQNPQIPSAPSALLQWGRLRRQETKQQTIGKAIGETMKNNLI